MSQREPHQQRHPVADPQPRHPADERPRPRRHRELGPVEQRPQHDRGAGLHEVEHPRGHPTTDGVAQRRGDVDEGAAAGGEEHGGPGQRVGNRDAEHLRGRGRGDEAEGGQAHRRHRAGQALSEASVEVDPQARAVGGRQRVQRGDRARLGQPERAGVVDRPFDVLRGAEVRLHAPAERGELEPGGVGHGQRGVAGAVLDDRCAGGAVVDDDVVGVHRAGHDRLAQPGAGVDHRAGPSPGDRVGGEQHAGDLRGDHPLHNDRELYEAVVDPRVAAVADRTVGPERCPAAADRVEQGVGADHVEVGVLLTGEARRRQVLRGGRGADGDGHVGPERAVGRQHGLGDVIGHRRGEDRGPRAGGEAVLGAVEELPDTGRLRHACVGRGRHAEAVGHGEAGGEQLPEVGGLAADERQQRRVEVREVDDGGEGGGHETNGNAIEPETQQAMNKLRRAGRSGRGSRAAAAGPGRRRGRAPARSRWCGRRRRARPTDRSRSTR